ncbi:NUDIX domain-containing protein [Cupriavidus necator]|uniref:NUDIX domain-containing protein n=1 Tax=Cupriavidus necator TaxID=106590 RepID=UPI0023506466|nr:NUDIX domain-containing protein [Cupriavidus necator]
MQTYWKMTIVKRSAGLVVMRQFDGEWRCLVLRAYRNWDFPKGLPEPGEEPLQAALRETTEETGLTDLELPWGEDYRETEPYSKGKVARLYLALSSLGDVSLPVSVELGRPEHHEFRWVSFADAQALLPQRFWPILQWGRDMAANGSS